MLANWARVPANPLPLGCVLTLPATGSEMNGGAVVSREATNEKLFFVTPARLSAVLDPRSRNHLLAAAAAGGQRRRRRLRPHDRAVPDLSGRRAAAGPPGRGHPADADRRGPKGAGRSAELRRAGEPDVVRHPGPQRADRLRRAAGLDHAHDRPRVDGAVRHRSRPIAGRGRCPASGATSASGSGPSCCNMPIAWSAGTRCRSRPGDEDARIDQAIAKTEQFFRSLGVGTRLADYKIPADAAGPGRRAAGQTPHEAGRAWGPGRERSARNTNATRIRVRGELKYSVHAAVILSGGGSESRFPGEVLRALRMTAAAPGMTQVITPNRKSLPCLPTKSISTAPSSSRRETKGLYEPRGAEVAGRNGRAIEPSTTAR